MSRPKCLRCGAGAEWIQGRVPDEPADGSLAAPAGYAVGGDFYNGIEWLACWLLDHVEGETITEEQLRPWAAKAWAEHLKRHNG